ncbi:hypothetical protein BFGS084_00498 [Bacteroides fragilis]|nr:hypothetical protein BFGS084_00498 [Bacteroides fragilis]
MKNSYNGTVDISYYGGEATDSIYKDILLTLIITPFTH